MFTEYLKTFDGVISNAEKSKHVIQKDFFPIYDFVETYVKKNKLILSNVETLMDKEKTTFRSYTIYGENIFKHANNISNGIAAITIYVLMYTNKKNEDFTIVVNGSRFIQLYNIKKQLLRVITSVNVSGIRMYPPEFELIDIYHKLYSPKCADEWDKLLTFERIIRDQMYGRLKILGGYNSDAKKKHDHRQYLKGDLINNSIIINWLKGRDDYILIGINAINIISGLSGYNQKIQVVTGTPIEKFVGEFGNLIFQYTGFHVSHKTHTSNILTEPRLRKTVVSVVIPDKKHNTKQTVHLLDIYNSASYELVPYTVYNNINIGYPNVLRMFMLIDAWYLRILSALKAVNDHTLKQCIGIIFKNLRNIDSVEISKYSTELYLGTYSDLKIFKQKEGLKNIYYPYNPEQYRYQKGNYRVIL
jgi:hypothetical protein